MTHVFNKKMRHDGLGIWLKAKFIAQSIMTHYNAFNIQGSAGQPDPHLSPTSPCREAKGASAHPELFRSAQEHLSQQCCHGCQPSMGC